MEMEQGEGHFHSVGLGRDRNPPLKSTRLKRRIERLRSSNKFKRPQRRKTRLSSLCPKTTPMITRWNTPKSTSRQHPLKHRLLARVYPTLGSGFLSRPRHSLIIQITPPAALATRWPSPITPPWWNGGKTGEIFTRRSRMRGSGRCGLQRRNIGLMGSKWPNGIPRRGPSSAGSGRSCKSSICA